MICPMLVSVASNVKLTVTAPEPSIVYTTVSFAPFALFNVNSVVMTVLPSSAVETVSPSSSSVMFLLAFFQVESIFLSLSFAALQKSGAGPSSIISSPRKT